MLLFIQWKAGVSGEGKPNGAIAAASSRAEMPWRTKEKQGNMAAQVSQGHFALRPAATRHWLADLAWIRPTWSRGSMWPGLEELSVQTYPSKQWVQLCGFWHCRNDFDGINPREELDLGGYYRESNLSSCHGHEVQLLFPPSLYLLKKIIKMHASS